MQLKDYRAKALARHLRRIVEHAKCEPTDTLTANALRLAKEDLRILTAAIAESDKQKN